MPLRRYRLRQGRLLQWAALPARGACAAGVV